MADDNQLENEILDFDGDALPELPEDNPFETERARRPWLLVGVGVLATVLVLAVVLKLFIDKGEETGLIEIPIDAPTVTAPGDDVAAKPDSTLGMPERVVEPRKPVTFDPDKPVVQRPKPRPISGQTAAVKTPAATAPKSGVWSVQFGAYNSRSLAEAGQRRIQSAHGGLFAGQNFAILTAVMPNGQTMHRLRVVGFATSGAANDFCSRARDGGLDCYVTR